MRRNFDDYDDLAPMYIDPDDIEEHAARHRERKHKQKIETLENRDQERMRHRDETNPASWTVTDSSFEFADRMHLLWHVAPWKVTTSDFRYALSSKRDAFNTTGDIEAKMMDIFFAKIQHDKRINNPDLIWKRFIKEFDSLLTQVKRESATPEEIESEKKRADRAWDNF